MELRPPRPRTVVRGLLLAIALYYAVLGGEYSTFDLARLRRDIDAQNAQLAASRLEVDSLHSLAESLENDPRAIERVARQRFGMIRDGEVLYRFVEVDSIPASEEPAGSVP